MNTYYRFLGLAFWVVGALIMGVNIILALCIIGGWIGAPWHYPWWCLPLVFAMGIGGWIAMKGGRTAWRVHSN